MNFKKEIIEELNKELALPFTGVEQDWDIEMADSNRIIDFLKFYNENDLSVDKKIAVISLVLASYEDFLNENDLEIDVRWNDIKTILKSERRIFIDLIDYWALPNEVEKAFFFRLTPLIRNII